MTKALQILLIISIGLLAENKLITLQNGLEGYEGCLDISTYKDNTSNNTSLGYYGTFDSSPDITMLPFANFCC